MCGKPWKVIQAGLGRRQIMEVNFQILCIKKSGAYLHLRVF